MRFIRTNAVSAIAKRLDTKNRAKMKAATNQSARFNALLLARFELSEQIEQFLLSLLHCLGLIVFSMVVVEQVQDAMHHQQRDLVLE